MIEIMKYLKISCLFLITLTCVTGLLYPGIVTLFSNLFFPYQAGGSLIYNNDKLVGSELIGQSFKEARYFWGRPSATTPYPYNASASSGSNLGATNPVLLKAIKERHTHLIRIHPHTHNHLHPPVDLLTASASGLDPHISPEAAFYQADRVARARRLSEKKIVYLIKKHIERPQFSILGTSRVNVLKLNLALDRLSD